MTPMTSEIAVIGAGVVGLAIAHRLAADGRRVIVIDPNEAGSGASFGNAGTVADYAVQPVGTPDVIRALPRLLLSRNSPLAIRHAAIASLAPWLLRFLRQSSPARARANAEALAVLLADATPRWMSLAEQIDASPLLQQRGCLYMYETDRARKAAGADIGFRRDLGVQVEMVTPSELSVLEPGLPQAAGGGAFFPKAVFMSDPGAVVARLAKATEKAGVKFVRARAEGIERTVDGVLVLGTGLKVHARRVVIAAGAHSRGLARSAGDRVPLDTERGYHVEYDMTKARLSRPVCPTARGFYLCPMRGRLRVAGTVELGGLDAPPSPHRVARLDAGARAIFSDLGTPSRSWMGLRPSMPDSLPVIGASQAGPEVFHAYGHGHIGLTLAPITADIIAALIAGREPPIDPARYLPTRF